MGKKDGGSATRRERLKAQKKKARQKVVARQHAVTVASRRKAELAPFPGGGPARVDLPGGHWVIEVGAMEQRLERGLSLLEAGNVKEAGQLLSEVVDDAPPGSQWQGQAYLGLGTAYGQVGRHDDAARCFQKAAEILPDEPGPWYNLGLAAVSRHRLSEASRAWRRCLELNPETALRRSAEEMLGAVEKEWADRIARSPGLTRDAIAQHEAVYFEGVETLDAGDAPRAAELFRRATTIDPHHHRSWGNLGASLLAQGRKAEGRQALLKALELKPDYTFAKRNLVALESGGELREVVTYREGEEPWK